MIEMSNTVKAEISYSSVHDLIEQAKTADKNAKFNFYGIITFIGPTRNRCTTITVVDGSCNVTEKLKCNIFNENNDLRLISNCCEVGDIIRCHRLTLKMFNNNPQGCGGEKICSWLRFKSSDTSMDFISNKETTISENDQKIVNELREWLKTNPVSDALYEAKLSENITDLALLNPLNQTNSENCLKYYLWNLKLAQFCRIYTEGYLDIICQVCAICKKNDNNFIIVWDGTHSKLAIHQENEFDIMNRKTGSIDDSEDSLYSPQIKEYLFQIFIFDEFETCLKNIKAGDYILLRNLKVVKPNNSNADLIMKLPGDVEKKGVMYRRVLLKLADFDANTSHLSKFNEVDTIIKSIQLKGKNENIAFISEEAFKTEFCSQLIIHNETFDEAIVRDKVRISSSDNRPLISNSVNGASKISDSSIKDKSSKSDVEKLLEDDADGYSNSENEDSFKSMISNKENIIRTSPQKRKLTSFESDSFQNLPNQKETILENKFTQQITSTLEIATDSKIDKFHQPLPRNEIDKDDILEYLTDDLSTQNSNENLVNTQLKLIDQYETCDEIHQLAYLAEKSYLLPFLAANENILSKLSQIPFFTSLNNLKLEMKNKKFLRSKVEACPFRQSIQCPPVANLFVTCKNCQYINFTPFNFIGSHQPGLLKNILLNYDTDIGDTQPGLFSNEQQEQVERLNKIECAKNFSLRWLNTAEPTLGESNNQNDKSVVMFYHCPRCALKCSCLRCNEFDELQESSQLEEYENSLCSIKLEYTYRFWFLMRDGTSELNPCLLEGDLATKFLDNISAYEFFTISSKRNQVYKKILESCLKKYLFTIDSFRLKTSKFSNKVIARNSADVMHKIVEIQEIFETHR